MEIDESVLTVFAPAWGDHLNYLHRLVLPSVMSSGNLPACGYHKIFVEGSSVGNTNELRSILTDGLMGLPADVRCAEFPNEQAAMLSGLRHAIAMCRFRHSRMLMLVPDTIIGDGGISNMREYARNKPVSVAAPHLRVKADTFQSDGLRGASGMAGRVHVDNRNLVNLAFKYAHQSLSDSFAANDNGTFKGGISLTPVNHELTAIIHYLPTVRLAWFNDNDMDFFNRARDFGAWDHSWPDHLVKDGRLRVFGSSELFFAVELTDESRNRIEVRAGSKFEEDSDQGPSIMKTFVGCLKK